MFQILAAPRDAKKCRAAGMEEGPKATLDIQCLQRGSFNLDDQLIPPPRGDGSARAITA